MADKTKETGLVKHDAAALVAKFDNDNFHYLAPKTMMEEVPRGMRLIATRVDVNPDTKKSDDVYPIPGGDKLGITKPKLNQCAAAAGITWLHSKRIDDRKHPHYVEWEVKARMVTMDGTVREETSNKTIDFRRDIGDGEKTEGSDRKAMTSQKQLAQAMPNISSLAETKAKNRCIRSLTGMQTSYTAADLKKPFIFVKLTVDPTSEAGGQAAMAAMYGATDALFGGSKQKVVDAELVDEPAAAAGGDEPPDEPAPEGEDVNPETGEVAVGTPEIIEQVKKLWAYAKKNKMNGPTFKELCHVATKKDRKELFHQDDVNELVQRVEAWIANQDKPDDDDTPV